MTLQDAVAAAMTTHYCHNFNQMLLLLWLCFGLGIEWGLGLPGLLVAHGGQTGLKVFVKKIANLPASSNQVCSCTC